MPVSENKNHCMLIQQSIKQASAMTACLSSYRNWWAWCSYTFSLLYRGKNRSQTRVWCRIDVWIKTSINPLKYSGHSDEHLKINYLSIFNYLQGRWKTFGAQNHLGRKQDRISQTLMAGDRTIPSVDHQLQAITSTLGEQIKSSFYVDLLRTRHRWYSHHGHLPLTSVSGWEAAEC